MRNRILASLALGAALIGTNMSTPAYAADTECRGTFGAVTLVGNVIVPDDATCTLNGTQVDGSITVKSRATLRASAITITGGIQGESAARLVLDNGSRTGNGVSLRKGVEVSISGSYLKGDLQLEENVGAVNISGNEIVGSIQANKNRGGTVIASNLIGNGLQCQDNTPPPTGGGNVAKQKQGQCVNL